MITVKSKIKIQRKNANALRIDQRRKKNKYEMIVFGILKEIGVNFEWQQPFYTAGRFCVTDFYLPGFKIVIEVDGAHHKKKRDLNRTEWLYKQGVKKVFRVTNSDVLKKPEVVKQRIMNVISYHECEV